MRLKANKGYHFIIGTRRAGVSYWLTRKRTEKLIDFIEYELWAYIDMRSDYLKVRTILYDILEGKYDNK